MLQEALLAPTLRYSLVSLCITLLCEVAPRAFLESLELMYFPVSGPLHHLFPLPRGLSSPLCAHHFLLFLLVLAHRSLPPENLL